MSFSLPKNVPSFESSQRSYENVYWGNSGKTHQNGNTGNRIGNTIGAYFENNDLPMYKDKPYSYGTSRRKAPILRRKKVWFGVILFLFGCLAYMEMFSPFMELRNQNSGLWKWFTKPEKSPPSVDWDVRRERVKDAFKLSWDGYERHAWGMSRTVPAERHWRQLLISFVHGRAC